MIQRRGKPANAMPRLVFLIGMLLLLALITACAASAPTRDEIIAERAQARWDALLAGDFESAYAFLTPGVRSTMTATDMEIEFRLRRVQYLSAEYLDHGCADQVCTVKIRVGFRVAKPVVGMKEWESESTAEEQWILSGGQWWYLPEK